MLTSLLSIMDEDKKLLHAEGQIIETTWNQTKTLSLTAYML